MVDMCRSDIVDDFKKYTITWAHMFNKDREEGTTRVSLLFYKKYEGQEIEDEQEKINQIIDLAHQEWEHRDTKKPQVKVSMIGIIQNFEAEAQSLVKMLVMDYYIHDTVETSSMNRDNMLFFYKEKYLLPAIS